MAAMTAARSLLGSWVQMSSLGVGRMLLPPGGGHSLEECDQFGNGFGGQDGGLETRLRGQIGADHGNITDLTGCNLDLAMADVSG